MTNNFKSSHRLYVNKKNTLRSVGKSKDTKRMSIQIYMTAQNLVV